MIKYYVKVLQNYASLEGRARRAECWSFYFLNISVFVIVDIMLITTLELFAKRSFTELIAFFYLSLMILYFVFTSLPSVAVAVRRIHDVGKSGWYLFVPIYNIILLASKGNRGKNKYGDDSKGSFLDNQIESFGK